MSNIIHVKFSKPQERAIMKAIQKTQETGEAHHVGGTIQRTQLSEDMGTPVHFSALHFKRLKAHYKRGHKHIPITIHHRGGFLWGLLPALGRLVASIAPKALQVAKTAGSALVKNAPSLLTKGAKEGAKLLVPAVGTAVIDNMMKPKEESTQLPTKPDEPTTTTQTAKGMVRMRNVRMPTVRDEPMPTAGMGMKRKKMRGRGLKKGKAKPKSGRGLEDETLFEIGKNRYQQANDKFKKKITEAVHQKKEVQKKAEAPAIGEAVLVNRQYMRQKPKSLEEIIKSQYRVNQLMQ